MLVTTAFGLAGAGYAAWTSSLHVEGQVRTANVDAIWDRVNFQVDVKESIDTVNPGTGGVISRPIPPEMDVADCLVDVESGASAQQVNFQIINAFPTYACQMTLSGRIAGTVPVHISAIERMAQDEAGNDVLGRDVTVNARVVQGREARRTGQTRCQKSQRLRLGTQLHNGDRFCVIVKVRVNEESKMGHSYTAAARIDLTQWNLSAR